MEEIEIKRYDDVLYKRGEKVRSTRVETLSFGGRSVELDLTDSTTKEIAETLAYLFDMGRPARGKAKQPPTAHEQKSAASSAGHGSRDHIAAMREYADSAGINYRTPRGGYYYSKKLHEQYAAHLATQERGI